MSEIKIEIKGKLTSGYYNDMEAGYPVFIDGDSLSDVVKDKLEEMGLDSNFCHGEYDNIKNEYSKSDNPLIGKSVTLILIIDN